MDAKRIREIFDTLPSKRKQVLLRVLAGESKAKIALDICDGSEDAVQQNLRQLYKDFQLRDERERKRPGLIALFAKSMPELIGVGNSQGINESQPSVYDDETWVGGEEPKIANPSTSVDQSTVQTLEGGRAIRQDNFVALYKGVGIDDSEAQVDNNLFPQTKAIPEFSQYDSFWVGGEEGREKLVKQLSDRLRASCRLLLILGLTGIGKTALAERLAVELQDWLQEDWKNRWRIANFDKGKATDFVSVAKNWLYEWYGEGSPEDNKPERLFDKLVKHLRENQVLVLIDSLENLLKENQEGGWGDFVDEWWEKLFLTVLSAESCQSRLIITSQDRPVKLVDFRYKNFWHQQILYGLDESEQVALFKTTGLDISPELADRLLLLRIGKAYKGHPLVLRVISGEIKNEPFNGNVQAYWNDICDKIKDVEKALAEAEQGKVVGEKDEWELHKLTREVRYQVNKKRLQIVFDRLEKQVKDAYILLCAASVYRAPVQEEGWLMQLVNLVKRLEAQECSEVRKDKALEELCNRYLLEESVNHNNKRVLGQHNLVRSVALEHYKKLVQTLKHEVNSL